MSLHSPKNKYLAKVYLEPAAKELCSVITFTSNEIELLYKIAKDYKYSSVEIYRNEETYPKFKWVLISRKYRNEK
ncbi:MAG: hypothetical protein ACI4TD_00655 [Phocaeicola sp.]